MNVLVAFRVHKGLHMEEPQFLLKAPNSFTHAGNYHVTTGYDKDLLSAAKKAVAYMIDYLTGQHNLTRGEAYMLCSIVGDLQIIQVVDVPHYLVSACLPLDIFQG